MSRRVFLKFGGSFVSLEPNKMFCTEFNSTCSELFFCARNCVPAFPLLGYLQTPSCTTLKEKLDNDSPDLVKSPEISSHFISCLWKSLREQMCLAACLRNQPDSGFNELRRGANPAVKDSSLNMP